VKRNTIFITINVSVNIKLVEFDIIVNKYMY